MNNSEIILYTTPQGDVKPEVIVQDETVWPTQKAVGELFGVTKKTISGHLGNIYSSNELGCEATIWKIQTVQNEACRAEITLNFYKPVQNKLHWDITGQTAAEVISSRAKAELPKMGLTT